MISGPKNPYEITIDQFRVLFNCCSDYFINLAYKFPLMSKFGNLVNVNVARLSESLRCQIPDLFYDARHCVTAPDYKAQYSNPNQMYSILDLIEYMSANISDTGRPIQDTLITHNSTFRDFFSVINRNFEELRLAYRLEPDKIIKRIPPKIPLTPEEMKALLAVPEPGVQKLLQEAIDKFYSRKPSENMNAVRSLWDAFERLKTFYKNERKDRSADHVIENIAQGVPNLEKLFQDEFKELTFIGNNYNIRHSETYQPEISDPRIYDYFFNRCISLLALAVHYLGE